MASGESIEEIAATTIAEVRSICAELPECNVESTGEESQHAKLSVRGKTIGWHTVDHHGDGRVSLTVRAARGDNEALVGSDPERFFLPAYVAQHGYVGMHIDTDDVDWAEVRELVIDAYRIVAPRRLAKQVE